MALNTATPETSWGEVHLYIGTPGAGDILATDFEDLGIIDEEGIAIETEDGETYELKDINGKLIDKLTTEPTLSITATLVKPSEATRGKFWKMKEEGEGDNRKVWVDSMISSKKYSVKLAIPDRPDTETFEVPLCAVSMKPEWTKEKGFTAPVTFDVIEGATGKLFAFGKPAATAE